MKIDVYSHIMPERYLAAYREKTKLGSEIRGPRENKALYEIDVRLRVMDRYPDVVQVLTMGFSALETLPPSDAVELARIANDELAELLVRYPDKFIAAVACLPLNDMDAALEEADRAITQLKLKGVQIFTNINGELLDLPKFRPLYEKMANYDLPIWIHPRVDSKRRETLSTFEGVSPFDQETASAMMQLVSAGIFQDYPDIKFITHHCGGITPILVGRIRWTFPRIVGEGHIRNPIEHLRKFYNDTAVSGSTAALMCGYDFFGADHLLFGTDAPLGPSFGLTRETIYSVEQMDIPDIDKEKIFERNAVKLLRLEI